MIVNRIIKPWNNCFKAFLLVVGLTPSFSEAQNTLNKELKASTIKTITINGNQIFDISIVSAQTNAILISSTLDGEYQNNYQIATKIDQNELLLGLEYMAFEDIPDDKRNAHKVIAAELTLTIPHNLNINIISDIGSVEIKGEYNIILIELLQGHFRADALSKNATINTIDGRIDVMTKNTKINASSKNGKVSADSFNSSKYQWNLKSVNGNITVLKKE